MSVAELVADRTTEVLNVCGDRVRVLTDGEMTGGRCAVFEIDTEPGSGPPMHRHGMDDELFYVVEGEVKFVVDGETKIVRGGESIMAPRNSTHAFCNVGERTSRMIVTTSPAGLETAFREAHQLHQAGACNPDTLSEAFAKINLTFHGPPLSSR